MIREAELFSPDEVVHFDRGIIDSVAIPMGDIYGGEVFTDYLSFYSGYAHKFRPKRIFEIGVRFGYSAISMLMGAHKNPGSPKPCYIGIDDESYHYGSCAKANENFAQLVPWAEAKATRWNSFSELPPGLGTFQLVSIDGNHDHHGVLQDLQKTWPLLDVGGVIVLDDAKPTNDDGTPAPIFRAIRDFLLQFNCSQNIVEVQLVENLRWHYLIRKVD